MNMDEKLENQFKFCNQKFESITEQVKMRADHQDTVLLDMHKDIKFLMKKVAIGNGEAPIIQIVSDNAKFVRNMKRTLIWLLATLTTSCLIPLIIFVGVKIVGMLNG